MKVTKQQMQLYAITDRHWLNGADLSEQVEDVLNNGATFLQLREKEVPHQQIVDEAKKIKPLCLRYHVPFVINDDIMAAKEVGADGVHIGQSDMDYSQARMILGPDKIIGMTAKTVAQAREAERLGADYIGVGAVFHTTTKEDAKDMSRETLLAITKAVHIPVIAIGGVTYENIDELEGTGVNGVSVVSAIFAQKDPGLATRRLKEKAARLFPPEKVENLIFDMDGTLLDSMPFWKRLAREYAVKEGVILPDDFDHRTYTMTIDECCDYFKEELAIKKSSDIMKEEILSMINEHYQKDIPMKPGMKELLLQKKEQGCRMCLFTTSDRTCAFHALERLGILDCFEHIYTVYEIGLTKREPEGYKKICELMDYEPSETTVYEDVIHAVESAHKAGCRVVAVYDEDSKEHWDRICELADQTICPQ